MREIVIFLIKKLFKLKKKCEFNNQKSSDVSASFIIKEFW